MTTPPALVLLRPEPEPADIRDLAAKARELAEEVELRLIKTFRTRRCDVVGEAWRRPVQFLEPIDARDLYRAIHRHQALILSFTRVFVRRDPRRQPAVRRAALELGKFVEHKAACHLIRDAVGVRMAINGFTQGDGSVSCTGEEDPRCLPLHAFNVDQDWAGLSRQRGRDAFDTRHGLPRSRLDTDGKRWTRADHGAYHGRDRLTVAGFELLPGMHWDVTSERGRAQLMTASEIWTLPRGPRGYVNVYPDAHVRAISRSTARHTWSASRSGQA